MMPSVHQTLIGKTDQLNADALLNGKTMTIKITSVDLMVGNEQPINIHYDGENGRPFKPCLGMRRVIASIWGDDYDRWVGKQMTLYNDPSVMFGPETMGGIRISHMSDMNHPVTVSLTVGRKRRKPFTVKPLHLSIGPSRAPLEAAARAAAEKGGDAFKSFFKEIAADDRAYLRPTIGVYQEIATKADAAAVQADDVSEDELADQTSNKESK